MSDDSLSYSAGGNFANMTDEEKQQFFANIALSSPTLTPEAYEFFAFVVNGKVEAIFIATKQTMQNYIDALSSNPIIVKLSTAQKNVVEMGWDYDEQSGNFSQPE